MLLDGSRTPTQLIADSGLSESIVNEFVNILDRYRLIVEGDPFVDIISSRQYIDMLEDVVNPLYNTIALRNPLIRALNQSPIPESLVYGYAIENFHFQQRQSLFGSVILSAASLPKKALDLLKKAYLTEDGHDRLVLRAFSNPDPVVDSLMLPTTEALTAYLANLARSHPLSFISALSCIEGYHTYDGDLFAKVIDQQNAIFGAPFVEHDDINRSNDHGSVTRQILETLDVVTRLDADIAIKNVRRLLGMIDAHWTEIYTYYSNSQKDIPRMYPSEAPTPVPIPEITPGLRSYKMPKLRKSVDVQYEYDGVLVKYAGRQFRIQATQNVAIDLMMQRLDGTNSVESLAAEMQVSLDTLVAALNQLDSCGLLVEGQHDIPTYLSSITFIQSLEDWVPRWYKSYHGYQRFLKRLESGKASHDLLTQYAWEYYHITAQALSAIGPALSLETDAVRADLLRDFYMEEIGHEKMLGRVLTSLGVSPDQIHHSIPLPSTSFVVEMLRFLAAHDPLSFMGALFLFEGTEGQKDTLVELITEHYPHLPSVYTDMLRQHDSINEKAEHGDISRKLYATIGGISLDDARRVIGTLYNLISLIDGFYAGLLERDDLIYVPIDHVS